MSVRAALRRVPGVRTTKQLIVGAYRQLRPLRPPVESPALVKKMLVTEEDDSFITGNGIAAHCRYVLNYDVFRINEEVDNNWWFCNPEFLEYFFRSVAPAEDYVLLTQNSNVDRPVGRRFEKRLAQPELLAWFSPHVDLRHPKLFPMPLGVGNPLKCDTDALRRARDSSSRKSQLFEASFDVRTNADERNYCIEQTGIQPLAKTSWQEYFERLASSYFCISPRGNGIDCYRTWQALHVRTIPVVTRSLLSEHHPEIPMIVLDDWADFRSVDFSPELYERTLGAWDPAEISLSRYLDRIKATIRRLSGYGELVSRAASS